MANLTRSLEAAEEARQQKLEQPGGQVATPVELPSPSDHGSEPAAAQPIPFASITAGFRVER